ncbi:MAG: TetR/AcrR family transcriptional regulator [Myxococcales bacterium]|nr:TetR/AcrR family transcriptional regulator [Myxococcales bacterium]
MTEDTRARILHSARDLVLQSGLEGVSMRRIARRAGVGTMTTYRHFQDKQDLLAHVVVEGFRLFQSFFYAALEGADPADRLRRSALSYLAFALEHPQYYRLMFASVPLRSLKLGEVGRRQVGAALQFLTDRVAECATAGVLQTDDPRTTALSLWSHAHGLVSLHLSDRYDSDVDFTELYHQSIARTLAGWGLESPA